MSTSLSKKGRPISVQGVFVGGGTPWSQRPDEPAKAYDLFLRFLQLPRRSLRALVKTMKRKTVPDGLSEVARRFEWENRAESWDVYRAKLRQEAMERKERKAALAETQAVTDVMLATSELVRRWKKDVMGNRDKRLGPRDLREYLQASISLCRLLRDQPQSIVGRDMRASRVRKELHEKLEQIARDIRGKDSKVPTSTEEAPTPARVIN